MAITLGELLFWLASKAHCSQKLAIHLLHIQLKSDVIKILISCVLLGSRRHNNDTYVFHFLTLSLVFLLCLSTRLFIHLQFEQGNSSRLWVKDENVEVFVNRKYKICILSLLNYVIILTNYIYLLYLIKACHSALLAPPSLPQTLNQCVQTHKQCYYVNLK